MRVIRDEIAWVRANEVWSGVCVGGGEGGLSLSSVWTH